MQSVFESKGVHPMGKHIELLARGSGMTQLKNGSNQVSAKDGPD